MLFSRLTSAILPLISLTAAKIFYAGVNESGGEFGVYSATATNGTGLPGRFGVDYQFINQSTIDIFVSQGVNLFRVAFLLERMCPVAYGLGRKFNETYYTEFEMAVNYITDVQGAYCILDPHNYMRYNDPSSQPGSGSVIGSSDPNAASTAQFQKFWNELAGRFANNEKVIFGIMNEPHDMPTSLVLKNDQAAITGIRNSGARQLIIAPGNGYTGGHAWNSSSQGDAPSSQYMYMLKDPINNLAIDIHEYFDEDFSGSHVNCTNPAPAQLYGLTKWLQQYNLKAMITEFGGSPTPGCASDIKGLINYMNNNDEYIGWSAWAAGPLWGTYSPCCDNYGANGSLEPNSHASDGGPGFYQLVWQAIIQPLIPKGLQKTGISNVNGPKGFSKA